MGGKARVIICNLQIGKLRLRDEHKPGLPLLMPPCLALSWDSDKHIITQVEQTRGCAGMQQRERKEWEEMGNKL